VFYLGEDLLVVTVLIRVFVEIVKVKSKFCPLKVSQAMALMSTIVFQRKENVVKQQLRLHKLGWFNGLVGSV
jgi:hypothetical protein